MAAAYGPITDHRWYVCDTATRTSICVATLDAAHAIISMADHTAFSPTVIAHVWRQHYNDEPARGRSSWWRWKQQLVWIGESPLREAYERCADTRNVSGEWLVIYNSRHGDEHLVTDRLQAMDWPHAPS